MVSPEVEQGKELPEGVKEVKEPQVPVSISELGVSQTPSQVGHQVQDVGQPVIGPPAAATITIQIPTSQTQLADWSRGSPGNSLTWFAMFWLRMIKKAL